MVMDNLALCILASGDFWTAGLWQIWLKDAKNVKAYIHMSNVTTVEEAVYEEWCKKTESVMVASVETAWGTPSLVEAEMRLFDAAAPHSEHMWLVSEKTIPLFSAQTMQTHLKTLYLNSSVITTFGVRENNNLAAIKCTNNTGKNVVLGSQFMILHSAHYLKIQPTLLLANKMAADNWEWPCLGQLAPDEFVIQTELVHTFPLDVFQTKLVIWESFKHKADRATELSDAQSVLRIALTLKSLKKWPYSFGMRKVKDSLKVRQALFNDGVLSSILIT
jgi:hypothetical protein